MEKYLFTADWHIGHHNILNLCNRNFKDIKNHDLIITQRLNQFSDENTIIYNLGDMGYRCSPLYLSEIIHKMKFKKMYVLWGNHDEVFYKGYIKGLYIDIQDKIELIGRYNKSERTLKNVCINNQWISLFHYGLRTWDGAFRGAWHLYGHSHGNLPGIYKSLDVGVDTNNYYPYTFEQIEKIMAAKVDLFREK